MNKVYIIPNMTKNHAQTVFKSVLEYFLSDGYQVFLDTDTRKKMAMEYPSEIIFDSPHGCMSGCDFVAVIGGDGTLLHAAPMSARLDKPILGINNGKLGFMTELDASELFKLSAIKSKKSYIEERMLLDVEVYDSKKQKIFAETVLNDCVIKALHGKICDIKVNVDGQAVMEFRGDGIIVSTPTGSTAYSLSAGGPIIEPSASCIAVTPICPHALTIKSFVLSGDRTVKISQIIKGPNRELSLDGESAYELNSGDQVIIKRSDIRLKMLKITENNFYDRINKKLVK